MLSVEPDTLPQNAIEKEVVQEGKAVTSAKVRNRRFVKMSEGATKPKRRAPASSSRKGPSGKKMPTALKSKSSTMPGFSSLDASQNQLARNRALRLAEERTGIKHKDSAEEAAKRRAKHGIDMYKASTSVPDSMLQFAGEIHNIDRITPKEEIILGEKTQEAIRLQGVYDSLEEKLEREPTDAEWCAAAGKINMEAISQAIEEGLEAKNKLVESNLRMVQGVVNVYIRNGLRGQYNAGDLMQEGILALIRAAEKYDPNRGFRFSTYAMYWIRSAVKRSQIYQSRVITVPQRLYENHKRLNRVYAEMSKELGRPPTKKELGDSVGMTGTQVERCCAAMSQQIYSLDNPLFNSKKPTSDDDKDTLVGLIACTTNDSDYNKLKHMFMREDLLETLHRHLSNEEVRLLTLRYGIGAPVAKTKKNGMLTIAEISRTVGIKPDKVRRIINKSLKHLRACIGDEWRDFDREYET